MFGLSPEVMDTIGLIADIIGVFGAVFAFLAWFQLRSEKTRKLQNIAVRLRSGRRYIELPGKIQRGEFSRAEVLGRLGMLPMKVKEKRFSLPYTNTEEYITNIYRIANSNAETLLEISCNDSELDQFDVAIKTF